MSRRRRRDKREGSRPSRTRRAGDGDAAGGAHGTDGAGRGPFNGRRAYVMAGGVVAFVSAVALAAVATPAPHTGGDNAAYLALAYGLVEGLGYTELWSPELAPHTKYPPVFPVLLGTLVLAGATSWTAFKLLNAVLISFAALMAFSWASARRGPLAGGAVALLTLLSAGWLDASRWILSEPAFLAFTFLGLWAAERGLGGLEPIRAVKGKPAGPAAALAGGDPAAARWLAVAGAASIAGLLTRSAGLPLVLALLAALLLAGRKRASGAFAVAFTVPAVWWGLRARSGGEEGAYQSEFWMINPYEPELGTVGWLDLPARAWANLRLYTGEVLPGEWWSAAGSGSLWVLGIVLVGLGGWGWGRRLWTGKPGVPELFLPLYLGLILVWPEVWSGDRFILPVYPLLLLYAGETVARMGNRLGTVGSMALPAAGFLLLGAPALPGWLAMADDAARCRAVARNGDVFRCHGESFREFRDAAAWSGVNLPSDAVVLNRKPRIHYVLSGSRGRTFPFTQDPDVFLTEADATGARYLLMDHVDGISPFYLPAVITARPLVFCHLRGWGGGGGRPGTDLFGILPPEDRRTGGDTSLLEPCPPEYLARSPVDPPSEGDRVPLLLKESVELPPGRSRSSSPPDQSSPPP